MEYPIDLISARAPASNEGDTLEKVKSRSRLIKGRRGPSKTKTNVAQVRRSLESSSRRASELSVLPCVHLFIKGLKVAWAKKQG